MSEFCNIMAKVSVEGLDHLGKNPAAGLYVCASSGVYFPAAAPAVCAATTVATAVGKWAGTPAGKSLMEMALKKSCKVVVKAGDQVTEILIVKGKATGKVLETKVKEAKVTYSALNTPQGMEWLMRYMSSF